MIVFGQVNDTHFWPATEDGFGHDGLRAPERERVPDADDELGCRRRCAFHRAGGSLLCFRQRIKPSKRPSPTVPRMNGRATGMAIHASTTRPRETIAPARVPGTEKLPNAPRATWRCLSSLGGIKHHLRAPTTSQAFAD